MTFNELPAIEWTKGQLSNSLPRKLLLYFLDAIAFTLAFNLALLLNQVYFYIDLNLGYWAIIAMIILVKLTVFSIAGVYRISLSYLSLKDVTRIFLAITASSMLLSGICLTLWFLGKISFHPSILVNDYLLTLVFVGGMRITKRMYSQVFRQNQSVSTRRVLIVGAGNAGEITLRAMLLEKNTEYLPVGFIDDDPAKKGMTIHGVRVLGKRQDIPGLVKALKIDELLITMPSAQPSALKAVTQLGQKAGVNKIRVLPAFHSFLKGKVTVSDLRDIEVEDLLGREPVKIDTREIETYLKDKVILVTGGAGSIGSELCQQIASFRPERLVVMDQDETALFNLRRELLRRFEGLTLSVVVGDIQDKVGVYHTFSRFHPEVVFHSAAYKHVSMMEENPIEALRNNVLGTRTVGEAAHLFGTDKLVLISTDKAVNPTSVMGATKRMAEMVVQGLNAHNTCHYVAVRFGNVLGSRGSVVPIFQEQIKRGGPVTITHPNMRRYFMTPSEAAVLVLQAGAIGTGGEVFVLDMGEPVAVLDLAREMIQLAGLEPDNDIQIIFTQPTPGEKLFEDILTAEEGTMATKHQRIYVARTNGVHEIGNLNEALEQLEEKVLKNDERAALKILCEMVPNFNPSDSTYRRDEGVPQPVASS